MSDENHLASNAVSYFAMTIFALWGGLANYIRRARAGEVQYRIIELIGELIVSAFAGLVTGMLLLEFGTSQVLSVALAGIGGHMGTRLIYALEAALSARLGARITQDPPQPPAGSS